MQLKAYYIGVSLKLASTSQNRIMEVSIKEYL